MTSSPGLPLRADWTVTSAEAAKSLGRPLSNNAPNVVVNLLKPGDMRSDRANQLDFRVAKILRLGRTRANVALDLLNALNLDTILVPNQNVHPERGLVDADRHADAGDDGADRKDHGPDTTSKA